MGTDKTKSLEKYLKTVFDLLDRDVEFNEYRQVLVEMKGAGIEKQDAYDLFSQLMLQFRERNDEKRENRIMEILDIISGFCSPQLRVWSDPF